MVVRCFLRASEKFIRMSGLFLKRIIWACCLDTPSLAWTDSTSCCSLNSEQSLLPALWSPKQWGHFMGVVEQFSALCPASLHLAHIISPAQYFSP